MDLRLSVKRKYYFFLNKLKTPFLVYVLMRKLFVLTNGLSNDLFSKVISLCRPPRIAASTDGIIGTLDTKEIDWIATNIKRNGYHIFEQRLPLNIVNAAITFANEAPVRYLEKQGKKYGYSESKKVDRKAVDSPRFQIDEDKLFENQTLCALAHDPIFHAIASRYMNCNAILDLIAMWWTKPSDLARSEAAQMYHFDMDKIKFLKFFFYLTDVTPDTGPHCYIEGSHRRLTKKLQRDGRFTDEEVRANYPGEEKIFCGPPGTILAVDTRGLHKGAPPLTHERLIFQIEFCNSLIGKAYDLVPYAFVHSIGKSVITLHPEVYGRIYY